MASRNYDIDLGLPMHDQTLSSTWEGLVNNVANFIAYGCGSCAVASFMNMTMQEAKDAGVFTRNGDGGVESWIGLGKYTPNNKLERIVDRIVNQGQPTIVRVGPKGKTPAHFVTVTGFFGTLPTNSVGNAVCTAATADMVLINDPYRGRCSTLADLPRYYGSIEFLRY